MNAIYKIIGDDGREYGPATAEQIRQWVAENRAAMESWNEHVEQNGVPLAEFRQF